MHEINEDSENYFKNAEPREMVDWKNIVDQNFKSGEFKIIITFEVEVKTTEKPFCTKMQELL